MARKRIPKVRIARPNGRPFQLRYYCPQQQREVRISTGTRDEGQVEHQKKELEAKLLLGIETAPKARREFGPQMVSKWLRCTSICCPTVPWAHLESLTLNGFCITVNDTT